MSSSGLSDVYVDPERYARRRYLIRRTAHPADHTGTSCRKPNGRSGSGKNSEGSLIKALKDRNPSVRMSAAFALGKAGSRKAIPHLRELESDRKMPRCSEKTVGEIAGEAIRNIRSRNSAL